jgi:hypothetical protein
MLLQLNEFLLIAYVSVPHAALLPLSTENAVINADLFASNATVIFFVLIVGGTLMMFTITSSVAVHPFGEV